jgi:hypothetical protein
MNAPDKNYVTIPNTMDYANVVIRKLCAITNQPLGGATYRLSIFDPVTRGWIPIMSGSTPMEVTTTLPTGEARFANVPFMRTFAEPQFKLTEVAAPAGYELAPEEIIVAVDPNPVKDTIGGVESTNRWYICRRRR